VPDPRGRIPPYQIGRADRGFEARPAVTAVGLTEAPSSFLGRFFYDTIVHGAEALRFLVQRVGAERVVLGSDYPFPMGDPHPVDGVLRAGLSEEESRSVLGASALSALGPRAPAEGKSRFVHVNPRSERADVNKAR
jgi:aminocarboxymuconate-semialdehyde decarboxylase